MALRTYLGKFTDEGLNGINGPHKQRETVANIVFDLGGKRKAGHFTMGTYDRIMLLDLPAGDAPSKFKVAVESRGSIRLTALRTFDLDEARAIIEGAPKLAHDA